MKHKKHTIALLEEMASDLDRFAGGLDQDSDYHKGLRDGVLITRNAVVQRLREVREGKR